MKCVQFLTFLCAFSNISYSCHASEQSPDNAVISRQQSLPPSSPLHHRDPEVAEFRPPEMPQSPRHQQSQRGKGKESPLCLGDSADMDSVRDLDYADKGDHHFSSAIA